MNPRSYDQRKGPSKTFRNTDGEWIVPKIRHQILLCKCGIKYLKTRRGQTACLNRCWPAPH